MPKKSEFVLKDSPPELLLATGTTSPRGRSYSTSIARTKPGAAKIDEILLGTKLACVAVTDDQEGTLAKVSKLNPWHEVALTMITGSVEEAHEPLKRILKTHFGLELDHQIDINKIAGGRAVDTQGYIAHNDDIIVVSFRCTTSAFDWMTNFSVASSEWEPDEDVEQGHSGYFSCLAGRCFGGCMGGGGGGGKDGGGATKKKPRVHTGFYNNVLQVIPLFQMYVDPLLKPDQPPRTLYVVGHSLGAGLSTLATCYFLLQHDWKAGPHRILNISAGTPRSCKSSMATLVEEQLSELNPLGKAGMFRVVMDDDMVCKVPPDKTGYSHVGKVVFLTEDGEVIVGPKLRNMAQISEKEMKKMKDSGDPALVAALEIQTKEEKKVDNDEDDDEKKGVRDTVKSEYEKAVAKIPKPFRDHCPDCYLEPLLRLYEREREESEAGYLKEAVGHVLSENEKEEGN